MICFATILPYSSIPVLLYHQIAQTTVEEDHHRLAVPPRTFENQMKYLYDHGFTTITLDEYIRQTESKKKPRLKQVVITFDDGYLDTYTSAFPILQKYKFSASVFLITDFLGKTNAWKSCKPIMYMDWSHVKEMLKYRISFGSHSHTHPDLTAISQKKIRRELVVSKMIIEDALGIPIHHFAYPYGLYNREIVEMVKETSYESAYAVNTSCVGKFSVERFPITLKDTELSFKIKSNKLSSWVRSINNIFRKIK